MIAAEKLTKAYGLKTAIQDVSFFIGKGEIVGLLGPNGAGKTTVLRIMTCFMQPGSGTATVDGLSCRDESIEVRKRIGFLPENMPLYTDMSVVEGVIDTRDLIFYFVFCFFWLSMTLRFLHSRFWRG